MSEDRRAPSVGPSEHDRDWCHVYNAGDGIIEVVASLASHYDAQPDQPWEPKGRTIEQIVKEVDAMRTALDKALVRSQRLINFVMDLRP